MRAILLLLLAVAPAWAVSGPLLTFSSPASARVDVAADPAKPIDARW